MEAKRTKTGFKVPSRDTRERASSASKAQGNPKLQRFLACAEKHGLFPPVRQPDPGDWLATYNERGQSATSYIDDMRPRTKAKQRLYIQPLGDFSGQCSPSLDTLQEFAKSYLCMDVEVLAPIGLAQSPMNGDCLVAVFPGPVSGIQWQCDVCESLNPHNTTVCDICDNERPHGLGRRDKKRRREKVGEEATKEGDTDSNNQGRRALRPPVSTLVELRWRMNLGVRQLLTGDIEDMLRLIKPRDANCIVALTMEDLYPQESWNFVFGEASNGVGVFSFARYSPHFEKLGRRNNKQHVAPLTAEEYALLLRRSCQVMVHEVIHMFGVEHCIYYDCCMNGANHLAESDAQPLYLCPVDIHKLYAFHHKMLRNTSFDIEERYRGLLEFYQRTRGFEVDAEWVQKLLVVAFGHSAPEAMVYMEVEARTEDGLHDDDGAEKEKREDSETKSKSRGAIRVNVGKKGQASSKVVIVASMEELKDLGARKLNMAGGKRRQKLVFSPSGSPITHFDQIEEDATVFLALGDKL